MNLTVWSSGDSGASWQLEKLIAPGYAAYSSLVSLSDSRVGVFYENRPGFLKYFTVDIASQVFESVVV